MRAARILADFAGRWQFDRTVTDARGPDATVQGRAEWSAQTNGLLYAEAGLLRMRDQAPMEATRTYLWQDGLRVFFADGRFFHCVPPDGGEAVHDCPPDIYRVRYDFADWPRFETVWQVTGPHKDYRMVTRYRRDQER